MFSFELLERAAASFGMETAREIESQGAKKSLKVRLFRGVDVEFSDEADSRTESFLYAGIPQWVPLLGVGLVWGIAGVSLVRHWRLDPTTYGIFLVLLATQLASSFARDRAERARDRLNDRAYLLSNSPGERPQDGRQEPSLAPSLALLERAANSLGWATSRATYALTVHAQRGLILSFAEEHGKATRQRLYAPAGRPGVLSVVIILCLVVLGFTTQGLNTLFNGAVVASLVFGTVSSWGSADRAIERLYDRAYEVQDAELKTTRP